ncbi:GNAT family N-acetyltransferase [Larsenimonas rhizosphaerae]|uniref:GNAT family N-acetyltransferase n=1 Tax=Larsenimonas rhizosphaerae TaxID=2944682 RepID=A0AA41ZFK8_9GAMM|nr:GNAT family N-acetyltransferase [Larsenimonas rhizosphaerae]MCM2130555.1 GNAT family N-acetyltransferase [Larsenimonas rhizosphaerae]MCX2523259.1 GNAT family N-acetyltransferase [Larsenimonas rhizosphaerae]
MNASWPAYWREAVSPEDAEFACSLVNHTMTPYWRQRRMAFSRRKFMQLWPEMQACIIEFHGRQDGFIGWDLQGEISHLRELHLVDGLRGTGLGTRILRDWMALQWNSGAKEARLKVFEDNPARRLYYRMGFRVSHYFEDDTGLLGMRCVLAEHPGHTWSLNT